MSLEFKNAESRPKQSQDETFDNKKAQRAAEKAAERAEREAERAEREAEKLDKKQARQEKREDRTESKQQKRAARQAKRTENMREEDRVGIAEAIQQWKEGMVNDAKYFAKYLESDEIPGEVKVKIMAVMFESESNVQEEAMNYARGGVAYPSNDFKAREKALQLVIQYGGEALALDTLRLAANPDQWPQEKQAHIFSRFEMQDATWAAAQMEKLGAAEEALTIYNATLSNESVRNEEKIAVIKQMFLSKDSIIQGEAANWAVGGALSQVEVSQEVRLAMMDLVETYLGPEATEKFLEIKLRDGKINREQYGEVKKMLARVRSAEETKLANVGQRSVNKKA